jgi:hypothetical protein
MVDRSTYTNASPSVPGDDSGSDRGFVRQVAEHAAHMFQYLPATITLTSGSAPNTLTGTLLAPLNAGLIEGMSFWLQPNAANTGAMTIAVDGEAAVAITDHLGAGLNAGALSASGRYLLSFDGTRMRVVTNVEVGDVTQGVVEQIFTGDGTSAKPSGFPDNGLIFLEAWGAGGSGARETGLSDTATGGMGGAYADRIVTGADFGSSQSITIGSGGSATSAGSSAINGNDGGNTSIGSLLTAPGGAGGDTDGFFSSFPAYGSEDGGGMHNERISAFRAGAMGRSAASATIGSGSAGSSQLGGDGGGRSTTSSAAGAGSAPGGGGGANSGSGPSGAGARGEVRIKFVWP